MLDPTLIVVIVAVIALAIVGVVVWQRRTPTDKPPTPAASPPATGGSVAAPLRPPGLRGRLAKTRRAVGDRLNSILDRDRLDADFWTDLEDTLVAADVGIGTATSVVAAVRAQNPKDGDEARAALEQQLVEVLDGRDRTLHIGASPAVLLVVGVNGTGKTTSIAKLASQLRTGGSSVMLGAADTFRAAADEQLRTWADRVGVDIVSGQSGADPASVAFDAFQAARSRDVDVLIIDTAGRLQNKANLMDELSKVARILKREAGELDEVLLVIDGTTGQNAVAQARSFTDAVGVTGIVLTKLDGTARGGVAIAMEEELDIPVKYIGVGEGVDDLMPFDPEQFVDALLGA
jgi:fused signal recognition particle receptor